MNPSSELRFEKIPLNSGGGKMPALGFGTLIPDPTETKLATASALEAGFRHFDCAERYRNEREVGEALQAALASGKNCATGSLHHYQVVEHQSSAGTGRASV